MNMTVDTMNQYASIVNRALGSVQMQDGVNAVADVKDNTLVLTITGTDGQSRTLPISVPELDPPENPDMSLVDSVIDKLSAEKDVLGLDEKKLDELKKLLAELTSKLEKAADSASASVPSDSKQLLFDIFSILVLLAKVAQAQRDAARKARQADNKLIQQNILAQADQQKTDAIAGLISSLAVCAVQVAYMGYNLSKSGAAFKTQMDTSRNSGFDMARHMENMAMFEGDRAKINTAVTGLQEKYPDAFGRVSAEFANAEETNNLRTAADKIQVEKTELVKARSDLVKSTQDLEKARADVTGRIRTLDSEIQDMESKPHPDKMQIEFKRALRTQLQNNLAGNKGIPLEELSKKVADDQAKVNKLASDITAHMTDYKAACEKAYDISKYESAYERALADYNSVMDNGETPTQEQINALNAAEEDLKIASALRSQGYTTAPDGVFTNKDFTDHQTAAKAATFDKQQVMEKSRSYVVASQTMRTAEAKNAIANVIGQTLQGVIASSLKFGDIKVTKLQAQEKALEGHREQSKDLYDDAKELMNAVVQMLKAINATEVDSIKAIFA